MNRLILKSLALAGLTLQLGGNFPLANLQAQENQSQEIDKALLDRLIDNLDDSDKDKRREAALRLSEMGEAAAPAVPALIEALEDSDQQVWFFSITAIARIGSKAEAAIPSVLKGLDSGRRYDDQVWYRHAYALGSIGEAAIPAIRQGLKEGSSKTRSGCAKALSWIGDPAHALIPELVQALSDDSSRVRQHAAETLGAFGVASADTVVTRFNSDSITDEDELLALINALYWIGSPAQAAGEKLKEIADSENRDEVRALAIKALDRIQPFDTSDWAQLLTGLLTRIDPEQNPDLEQELRNAILLIRNPQKNVIPALADLLVGDSRAVADKAAATLGEYYEEALIATPSLVEAIQKWNLAQEDSAFVAALGKLGSDVVPYLLESLNQTNLEDLGESHWAIRALSGIRPSAALVSVLADQIEKGEAASKYAALNTMRSWVSELDSNGQWTPSMENQLRQSTLNAMDSQESAVQTAAWNLVPKLSWPSAASEKELLDEFSLTLESGAAPSRLAALEAIRSVDINLDPALPLLMDQLNAQDEATRIRVAQALGDFGQSVNEAAMGALTSKLDSFIEIEGSQEQESAEWGATLMNSLAQISMPDQASGLLARYARLVNSPRKELRVAALNSMGDLGPLSVALLPVVLDKTSDDEESVRLSAFEALTRISRQSRTVVPALTAGIQDASLAVRMFTTEEIGRFGREAQGPAEPLLFGVLNDSEVRKTALDTLRQIRTEALPLLKVALEHEDASVRLFACETLGFLGPRAEPAIPALERCLRDDYSFVRRQAQAALDKIRQ